MDGYSLYIHFDCCSVEAFNLNFPFPFTVHSVADSAFKPGIWEAVHTASGLLVWGEIDFQIRPLHLRVLNQILYGLHDYCNASLIV